MAAATVTQIQHQQQQQGAVPQASGQAGPNKRLRADLDDPAGPADRDQDLLQLLAGWRIDAETGELVIPGPVRIDGYLFVDGTLLHRGIQQLCSIAYKRVSGFVTHDEALSELRKMSFRHFAYKQGGGQQAGIIAEEALAAGSTVANRGPDGVPVFDQGSALAMIGRVVQWLQEQHASMASTLHLLLLARVVELTPALPGEAAGTPSSGGSSSDDSGSDAGDRPAMTREQAAALAESDLRDLSPEELAELINQLLRDAELPPEVAARKPTMQAVQKNKMGQKELMLKFFEELPLEEVAALLHSARFGKMPRVDGSDRPRSRLGHFLTQLKQLKRTRETSIDTTGVARKPLQLRDYQEEVLRIIQQPGNYMLVAPTGIGKTAIATMLVAEPIKPNPGWKAIFLEPTTSLVRQQTIQFAACQQIAELGRVDIRCGGLSGQEWPVLLERTSVLCVTPQTLANMFKHKAASFSQFQVLIFYECHDAKGFSAMAELLRLLRALPPGAPRPKVFGMTATPGADNSVPETVQKIQELAELMGATVGRLIELPEDDPRLAPYLVKPNEIVQEVEQRAADTAFCKRLGAVIVFAAKMLRSSLPRQPVAEEADAAQQLEQAGQPEQQGQPMEQDQERQEQQQQQQQQAEQGQQQQQQQQQAEQGQQQQQQQQQPAAGTSAAAEPTGAPAADATAELPPARPRGRRAPQLAELVRSKLLAGQWVGQVEGWNREACDFVQSHTLLSQAEKQEALRCLKLVCYCLDALHVTLSGAAARPAAADTAEPASAEPGAEGSDQPAAGGQGPGQQQGSKVPLNALLATLVGKLTEDVVNLNAISDAFSMTTACSPKFQALCDYLLTKLELASRSDSNSGDSGSKVQDSGSGCSCRGWHGIVFARTRASVIALRELLASRGELKRVTVVPFMGGGNKSASNRHRGMSKSQQSTAIDQFTAAEFGLLLATAAGEQGLDFPNCEFVVRYSVNETGQERLQSQGRARKAGGEYFTLLDVTGSDPSMDHRSQQQAHNQATALRQLAHSGGAVRLGTAAASAAL